MGYMPGMMSEQWPELAALVDDVISAHAAVAKAQAEEARLFAKAVELVLARSAERGRKRATIQDLPLREVSAELSTAVRTSDRSVQRRMGEAFSLCQEFPSTMSAWTSGEIDSGHVAAILSSGTGLDVDVRERFEELALDAARAESATRLQGTAKAIAARLDPEGSARRIRDAEAGRKVRVYDLGDGMSRLLADVPSVLANAIHDRLTQQAYAVRATSSDLDERPITDAEPNVDSDSNADTDSNADADDRSPDLTTGPAVRAETGRSPASESDDEPHETDPQEADPQEAEPEDTRTMDQLRADIFCDELLSGSPLAHGTGLEAVAGHVQITLPARALAGSGEEPAMLSTGELVSVDTARELAGIATSWHRVFTDPCTGAVVSVDRYRPSAELTRLLRARDERCRFPGCRRAAHRCDLDHNRDAALGGPTCVDNLCHLCRRHHTLKHQTAWTLRQLPGGVIEWRSPTGRHYQDRPPATVRFVPDPGPPPF